MGYIAQPLERSRLAFRPMSIPYPQATLNLHSSYGVAVLICHGLVITNLFTEVEAPT